jgi:HD-GYP domain-containing protein (c-di-GMP phosphodiesterase class II)
MTRSEEILNLSDSFGGDTFESKLKVLHEVLLSRLEFVDRLAIAIYDPATDLLKTFASSNRGNPPLRAYEARLADVPSLQRLADTHSARVVNDIAATPASGSAHSRWLREQGFQSSFTLPIYFGAQLAGFAFMDSRRPEAFAESTISFVGSFAQLAAQLYLSQLASIRDVETGVHLERIAKYARLIARGLVRMGHPLSDEFVEYVHLFAPLHDIGKVGIPDRILLKPGGLDNDEFALMQTHVELGLRMVEEMAIDNGLEDTEAARIMRNVVATHHERGDGSGYPKGLKSEQIPLEVRIVAVADVFDALSTPRSYKRAWAFEDCAQHLRELGAAGRLDPDCVQALLADPEDLYRIQRQFAEPEHALAAH